MLPTTLIAAGADETIAPRRTAANAFALLFLIGPS
jgi:hypothetical protein